MIQNAMTSPENTLLGDDRFTKVSVNVLTLDFSSKELAGVDYISLSVDGVKKTVIQSPTKI